MRSVIERPHETEHSKQSDRMEEEPFLEKFVSSRDEAAFEALMRRHGPMVLGVCTRVLGNHHDAEEAFQATFLVLSRKAASVMPRNRVGNWLHGVAYRTALKAQSLRERRRVREVQELNAPEPEIPQQDQWQEIAPLLDRELNSLPEKYRIPVVLCDLEGRSCKEVARDLGCPEGTLSSRLTRARSLLAQRLRRQGVVLSVGALAVMLSKNTAAVAVPHALMLPVLQAAQLSVLQPSVASGVISGNVVEITEGVVKSMFYSTVKRITIGLGLTAVLGVGAFELLPPFLAMEPKVSATVAIGLAPEPLVSVTATEEDVTFHFRGSVIDEHGNAMAGAKVWMSHRLTETNPPGLQPLAVTDERGEFSLSQKSTDFSKEYSPKPWTDAMMLATKDGHGFAASVAVYFETTGRIDAEHSPEQRRSRDDFWADTSNVLKLVADDLPIRGRILTTQGQPVANAQVEVFRVYGGANNTLDAWEAAAKTQGTNWFLAGRQLRYLFGYSPDKNPHFIPVARTDGDGFFTLNGIGRDRLVKIAVRGPDVETAVLYVRSRPGKNLSLSMYEDEGPTLLGTFYPNEFTHKLGPSIPVEGHVTDSRTGEPLADVLVYADKIASYQIFASQEAMAIHAKTDSEGNYRLEGLPMGENRIELIPPPGKVCKDQFYSVKTMPDQKPIVEVYTFSSTSLRPGVVKASQPSPIKPNPAAIAESIGFLQVFIYGNVIVLAALVLFVVTKRMRS